MGMVYIHKVSEEIRRDADLRNRMQSDHHLTHREIRNLLHRIFSEQSPFHVRFSESWNSVS